MPFSHSAISTFEQCPRKYAFQYVERIRVETEGVEAFLGKRVHESLEKLYAAARNKSILSEQDVLDFYFKQWEGKWHDSIKIVRELRAKEYQDIGEDMLRRYYTRHFPFNQSIVIATEERLDVFLGGSEIYRLTGVVDRIDKVEGGHWEIHDYKTESRLATQADKETDRQLALYEIGLRYKYPQIQEVTLVWHYLKFDEIIRSKRTFEQLEELKATTCATIDEILLATQADDFAPRESALCRWCAYQNLCPLFTHSAQLKAETPPVAAIGAHDIVNRLGAIKERKSALNKEKKNLEAETEKLERSLLDLAKEAKWQQIAGDSNIAKIKTDSAGVSKISLRRINGEQNSNGISL